MELELDFQNESTAQSVPDEDTLRGWLSMAFQDPAMSEHLPCALSIQVVDQAESQLANNTFRKKDHPTNVLSFPADEFAKHASGLLGDILLCGPVIEQEAATQHKTTEAHWAHMVLHGLLHLVGYDHETHPEAETMEALEIHLLKKMGYDNPYELEN